MNIEEFKESKILFIKGVFIKDCMPMDDIFEQQIVEQLNFETPIISYTQLPSIFRSLETWIKKTNIKLTLQGEYLRGSKLITKLFQKKEILPQTSRYITRAELWSKNNLKYPKGIAEDEAVFFPLLALSERTVVIPETFYKYRVGRPGSISSSQSNPQHAIDFLQRINFSIEFMTKRHDLIKTDLSAWRQRLTQKGLNYVSMCLKTKVTIDWLTLLVLFYRSKSIIFLIKLFWRFLKHFINVFFINNSKK